MRVGRLTLSCYLFLKVAVGEVEDLQRSISPGQSQSLSTAVKRHGSDSTGHVVEEPNTVYLELTHFTIMKKTKPNRRVVKTGQATAKTTYKPAVR